jgi:hypothetical protein
LVRLNAQHHPDWDKLRPLINSTKNFYDYQPDSEYLIEGRYPAALRTQAEESLVGYFSQNDTSRNHLKAFKGKGYTAKFDDRGNKVFEKYDEWTSIFKYEYDSNGRPASVSVLDSNKFVLSKAKYKYNAEGKLLQVGELVFKYYDNGSLKSIEDNSEIEIYKYDSNGKLTHIYYDLKPGGGGCGNRTTEWKGEYNSKGQLFIEHLFGFPEFTEYHEYSKDGLLIKTTTKDDLFTNTVTKYFYENGKLVSAKTYDVRLTRTNRITYVLIDTERYTY